MAAIIARVLLWVGSMGLVVFAPAGTFAYPGGWLLLIAMLVGGTWITLWLYKRDPELLRKRLAAPLQKHQQPWDRVFLTIFLICYLGWMAFMAFDARQHDFVFPIWAQALGLIGFASGLAGGYFTFRENTFAAPVVAMQSGHRVIDTGAYAHVRHPLYAGAVLYLIGLPLLLQSWNGLWLSPLMILAFAWRAVNEEKMLRAELPGYADYMARVRYRFVPGIW
jgi:protein-S-isoprenylcysteine O-methyltransferase Ste14